MNVKTEFKFKYRTSWPATVEVGNFYWIELNGEHQIWFSPDTNPNNMILLNDKSVDEDTITELINEVTDPKIREQLNAFREEILERISDLANIPTKVSELENDAGYLTENDLDDFVPDVELTDSDWERINDKITEKVDEKSVTLTWQVI
jgi:hypothetical protein